jgi:sulfur-carrier protein
MIGDNMARVWIPSLLRDVTGGQETVTVPGASVREVIDELDRLHPGARARLCDGDVLRRGLAVVVDNEVARLGLLQAVGPDSEVHFVPAIGGGQGGPPVWPLILVGLLHAELWAAAWLTLFSLVPRLLHAARDFGMTLPQLAEHLIQVAHGFLEWPFLFWVLPAIDAAVLFALHRVFPSRAARIAWSVVIAGLILSLLLWFAAAEGLMLEKLKEAFSQSRLPPPAP